MMQQVSFDIQLKIKGPILCTAKGESTYGVDAYFQQNWRGEWFVSSSHIKGKLKESWGQLKDHLGIMEEDITNWLGAEVRDDSNQHPQRGCLLISDFTCPAVNKEASIVETHRIRVHKETGTVDEGALLTFETPFASGKIYTWQGQVTIFIEENKLDDMRRNLLLGLKWITAIGANKGIGFGQLVEVNVSNGSPKPVTINLHQPTSSQPESDECFGLKIKPLEPLMIGGVRQKDNYLYSEKLISGGILKGSLAACINRRLGRGINEPIDGQINDFKILPKYFDKIRFTYAFPTVETQILKRPLRQPLSIIKAGEQYYDAINFAGPEVVEDKHIPEFCVDWKDPKALDGYFGLASPRYIALTRTAIDTESRRAKEEKLYTFFAIAPETDKKEPLVWLANIFLPEEQMARDGLSDADKALLKDEFAFVIKNWFDRLGKRNKSVQVELQDDLFPPKMRMNSVLNGDNDTLVVTLQTPALMLSSEVDLYYIEQRYCKYWEAISKGALTLVEKRFFAQQELRGGHLYYRYARRVSDQYAPYYLTSAGSTFLLKIRDTDKAEKMIQDWLKSGLSVPDWAISKYSDDEMAFSWQTCPFVPENGFGEIVVNLPCQDGTKTKTAIEFGGEIA